MMSFTLMGCLIFGASDAMAQGRSRSHGGSTSSRSQSAAVSRSNNNSKSPTVSRSSSSSTSRSTAPQVNRSSSSTSRSKDGASSRSVAPRSHNDQSKSMERSGNVTRHNDSYAGSTAKPSKPGNDNKGGNGGTIGRPGAQDRGGSKDGSRGNGKPGSSDNRGGGKSNYDNGDNGHKGDSGRNGYRPDGNGKGNRHDSRPDGNRSHGDNKPGKNHGYSPQNRYEYHDHHYRNDFARNYRYNNWSRPLPPPARAHRPAPWRWYRPAVPAGWHPYAGAPVIDRILGILFGTYFGESLNHLYCNGYYIDGYADDVIYLRDVPMLGIYWSDAMLNYSANRFANAQFVYFSDYYDTARYNVIANKLTRLYGPCVYRNGMERSWYGSDGIGYVTLSMMNDGTGYYTTMSIGY